MLGGQGGIRAGDILNCMHVSSCQNDHIRFTHLCFCTEIKEVASTKLTKAELKARRKRRKRERKMRANVTDGYPENDSERNLTCNLNPDLSRQLQCRPTRSEAHAATKRVQVTRTDTVLRWVNGYDVDTGASTLKQTKAQHRSSNSSTLQTVALSVPIRLTHSNPI